MSSSGDSEVGAELRLLAKSHEARRGSWRWRLRGWGWGLLAFLWLGTLSEPDAELVWVSVVFTLIVGGVVEAALRIGYRFAARAAAADFNRAFPMGTERDDAAALLRERCQLGKEPGRAARRCLRALCVPVEEPPEEAEPSPTEVPTLDPSAPAPRTPVRQPHAATIPIEVTARTENPPTSRESVPATLPLQPEAARGGEDE